MLGGITLFHDAFTEGHGKVCIFIRHILILFYFSYSFMYLPDQRTGCLCHKSIGEKDIDNLFLLADGTYAIVDYEAEYKKLNKIKYLNYIARVMEKYYKENENFDLRLIVIYTGDVKSAEPNFETHAGKGKNPLFLIWYLLCQIHNFFQHFLFPFGIDLPPIRELLPTNLPKISANEKDIDNLFLLADGTYAIVYIKAIPFLPL